MLSVSIKRKTNNLEKLIEKLEKINKQGVETGVFASQGEHPNADMTYVDLARMHEEGDGNFPPRTVRPILAHNIKEQPFLNKVTVALNKYLYSDLSANYFLSKVGEQLSSMGKSYFGVVHPSYMPSNSYITIDYKDGDNTPLVEEGYLKDAWAYKTSLSGQVVDSNYA